MADKRINQYQTKTTLTDDTFFPIGTDNTTKIVPFYDLKQILTDGLVMSNQGKSNAGKVLVVGNDGNVTLKRM